MKFTFEVSPKDGIEHCDFCNDSKIEGYFHKKPNSNLSNLENVDGMRVELVDADGIWAACKICQDLINKGDQIELAKRAARILVSDSPSKSFREVLAFIQTVHNSFWNDR